MPDNLLTVETPPAAAPSPEADAPPSLSSNDEPSVTASAEPPADTDSTAPPASMAPPAQPDAAAEPARPAVAELSPAACAARLAELFPAVFAPGSVRPLKLRIQADIQQRSPGVFTRKALSSFLHRHTTSTAYLRALANGDTRIDLDGAAAGDIADEHRQAAAQELERRRTVHAERRAAERDAQRAAFRDAQQQAMREHAAQADARRERAGLLRAFETTTLTLANFCALKSITPADLEATLALARQDREQAPPAMPSPAARPDHRADPRGRPDDERRHRGGPSGKQRPDARGAAPGGKGPGHAAGKATARPAGKAPGDAADR